MTPTLPACAPPRQTYSVCLQSLDLGGPILDTHAWPTHAWIVDSDEFDAGKHTPVVRTRTYRCLRCGETWSVSGEPAPGHFG